MKADVVDLQAVVLALTDLHILVAVVAGFLGGLLAYVLVGMFDSLRHFLDSRGA